MGVLQTYFQSGSFCGLLFLPLSWYTNQILYKKSCVIPQQCLFGFSMFVQSQINGQDQCRNKLSPLICECLSLNIIQGCQNQLKPICPPKPIHLNETQTHPIINWVKWVLTQLNSININVYWVLIGYPIKPNYDPSIIFTNHPTLKYPKTNKITKIPPQPKK